MIVNQEDPVKARLVDDRITALLAEANLFIARQIAAEGGRYLDLVVNGGEFDVLGQPVEILGLRAAAAILRSLRPAVPEALRDELDRAISLRHSGPRQPRRRRAADRPAGAADRRRQANGQRSNATARRLRDRRRGDLDADLRHPPARRRLAGPGAGGEHLPPPHRRARLALGAARREGRPGRRRGAGRDPADADRGAALRRPRVEPLRPLAGGDPRRGRRHWQRPGRRSGRRRATCEPSPCSPS